MVKNNEALEPITLSGPVFEGSKTLFEALKSRKTSRNIGAVEIPLQNLADILWAAQGVNRSRGPFDLSGRTAGSASNSQEICVYVALKQAIYRYEPPSHRLMPVVTGDHRRLAIGSGQSPAGANAPVRLIYVVDLEQFKHSGFEEPGLHDVEVQKSYYFVDTGLIAQNVYLAAAALGLAAWFHNCDKPALGKVLGLPSTQRVLFGQTIGYAED